MREIRASYEGHQFSDYVLLGRDGKLLAVVDARKILVEKCELKAVIAMPGSVFKPYAGVSTAILIFTKDGETENVWFYDMQSDVYSLDDKRTKQDGYVDLQDIVTQFKKRDPKDASDRKALKARDIPAQAIGQGLIIAG